MTNSGAFTHSQEEAILQEVGIKDFDGQFCLDEIPLSFPNEGFDFSSNSENFEESNRTVKNTHFFTQKPETHTTPIIGKDEFAGQYDFQLFLNLKNPGRHWVYSEKLSKVFIHMEEVLPLHFQWTPAIDGLWIRATMVYKLDQHRSQPVVRCHNHVAPDNISNQNLEHDHIKHVVRCLHPASSYHESPSGHLFVVTPLGLPAAGISNVPMDFKFFCKNSCTSGMNRRPTEILFTLETSENEVLGRRKLEVRVCSCPKRDKEKEEKERSGSLLNCTSSENQASIIGKKRKVNIYPELSLVKKTVDNQVYNLNLDIVGKENFNSVIKYAHDVMAGAAIRTGNHELYKPYIEETMRHTLT